MNGDDARMENDDTVRWEKMGEALDLRAVLAVLALPGSLLLLQAQFEIRRKGCPTRWVCRSASQLNQTQVENQRNW